LAEPGSDTDLEPLGPVARMMIAVAGHAITSHIQMRALLELLIGQGVVDRDTIEAQYNIMRDHELDVTVDEWFPPDIAAHLKVAFQDGEKDSEKTDTVTPEKDLHDKAGQA